ncbi:MAG TPA: hypothetical protein VF545_02980 [Thermoleophilaceae bacterium]|jgi:hypothetical protein
MGVLDDAIREHLELKRRHGAAEDEIARQETEALGPARRDVPAAADEAAEAGPGPVLHVEPVADVAPPPVTADAAPPPAAPVHDIDDELAPPPPVGGPPVEDPPVEDPPVEDPPVDEHSATDGGEDGPGTPPGRVS